MAQLYEIHCYHEDVFQYVVARTNKFSEEKVKKDIEQMNNMLSSELIRKGIRYVFAGVADGYGQLGSKQNRKKQQIGDDGLDCNTVPTGKTYSTEAASSDSNE
ncbi:MAG: hypothetical protein FIO03_08580 [Nitrosopumilales archaeon]|nr:hypothetical protein [Nitrosopumilales archaeon]